MRNTTDMQGCPQHGLEFMKVIQRSCNRSAFNGYRWTPSAYSTVECFAPTHCVFIIRTKASYVAGLPDATDSELGIRP